MSKQKYFGEGPLFTISNYFVGFLLNTIYFYICNIPLIALYLIPYGFKVTAESKYILFPLLIFIGPALTGLYGAMGKLAKYGDVSFLRDYFKSYKLGFKQSILVWFIGMSLIGILIVDCSYFSKFSFGFVFILMFKIFIAVIIIAGFYIFPIISKFELRTRDVLKLSIYYAVTSFKTTLLLAASFVAGLFIFQLNPAISLLFLPSIFCYLTMKLLSKTFIEIENRIVPKEECREEYKEEC